MSHRDDVMMHNEGHLLSFAASHTVELAAEHARGVIDGSFNALLRFEGPEETTKFAFAVADRISGKIKAPTQYPLQPAPVFVAPPPPAPRRYGFWTIWAIGVATGLVYSAMVLAPLMGTVR